MAFGGTATLTSIRYLCQSNVGQTAALLPQSAAVGESAAAVVIKAASTTASEQITIYIWGHVRINAGGTFIPQFKYSAAPGGAPTVKANSYFRLTPIGDNAVVSQGTWT